MTFWVSKMTIFHAASWDFHTFTIFNFFFPDFGRLKCSKVIFRVIDEKLT